MGKKLNETDTVSVIRSEPAVKFSFRLQVEGGFSVPCKSVKGFHKENEFEYIQEGGLNDYVHMLRKPISKPFTFQIERYVGLEDYDPLPLGVELALPVLLFVNGRMSGGSVKPVRTYTFTGCKVTAKDYGDLDGEQSGLAIETTTIAYQDMVCVELPTILYQEKYKGITAKDTEAKTYSPPGELTKKKMEALADKNLKDREAEKKKKLQEQTK